MRHLALLLLLWLPVSGFTQNWALISPPDTPVEFYNFLPELNFASDTELWVQGYDSWGATDFNLTVTGTAPLTDFELLVSCGSGSYSDGIYKMNTSTGNTNVVEYFYKPQFLKKEGDNFFTGYYGGVSISSDGESWDTLLQTTYDTAFVYFFTKNNNYIAVGFNEDNWFFMHSADFGETWASNDIYLPVNDVIYQSASNTFYIALGEGFSDNDGLYKSEDYGMNLTALRKEKGINALQQIDESHLALGYSGDSAEHVGVASYDLETTLHYSISGNLPEFDVSDLTTNPLVNTVNIVASTSTGAYQADNILEIIDLNTNNYNIKLYPNPAKDKINISGNIGRPALIACEVFDIQGKLMFKEYKKLSGNGGFSWQISDIDQRLTTGSYFLKIQSNDNVFAIKKFVKE